MRIPANAGMMVGVTLQIIPKLLLYKCCIRRFTESVRPIAREERIWFCLAGDGTTRPHPFVGLLQAGRRFGPSSAAVVLKGIAVGRRRPYPHLGALSQGNFGPLVSTPYHDLARKPLGPSTRTGAPSRRNPDRPGYAIAPNSKNRARELERARLMTDYRDGPCKPSSRHGFPTASACLADGITNQTEPKSCAAT